MSVVTNVAKFVFPMDAKSQNPIRGYWPMRFAKSKFRGSLLPNLNPETKQMTTVATDGLIPISMATLSPNALLGIDIYLKSDPESSPVLFYSSEELPDLSRLAPYVSQGVNKLFIDRSDREHYQRYLRENWHCFVRS